MRKAKKKKGMHPALAALIFVISATVAARQIFGSKFDNGLAAIGDALGEDPMLAEAEASDAESESQIAWRDLLAVHGPYAGSQSVRMAFVQAADASAFSAPGGESGLLMSEAWIGADPPSLSLGVIMISAASRRAVLGGSVLGINDSISNGKVVAIERGQIVLSWNGKILTYDLEDPNPREFRSEVQRRLAAKQVAAQQATSAAPTNTGAPRSTTPEVTK